jgi:hypothetical protein
MRVQERMRPVCDNVGGLPLQRCRLATADAGVCVCADGIPGRCRVRPGPLSCVENLRPEHGPAGQPARSLRISDLQPG